MFLRLFCNYLKKFTNIFIFLIKHALRILHYYCLLYLNCNYFEFDMFYDFLYLAFKF